jgi:hypothetical protein
MGRAIVIILTLLLFGAASGQQLAINEFLAQNDTTVTDQNGEYNDWIELYNYGATPISLANYHLSDKSDNPAKWTFPDIVIDSGAFLIVWADEDTIQAGLHANFKLSVTGEAIYLSSPQLSIIDHIVFGPQSSDISTGRFPDGIGAFKRMYPTFSASNNGSDIVIPDPGEAIYGDTRVHTFRLHFNIENWADTLKHYFEDLGKKYYPVTVTFDDTLVIGSVGVRYKGNSSYAQSRNTPKKPFKLKFDKYQTEQTLLGLHFVNLHNCINDPSFMREAISYHIARSILPAPRTAYANLYVDSTLIGFYVMAEQVDPTFLGGHFATNENNLYKAGNDGANMEYKGSHRNDYESDYGLKTNENDNDWSRFIRMIYKLNNTPDNVFADTMSHYLDLDYCIRLLAFNMVLSNFDSYTGSGRNYYLYDDMIGGNFKIIPWDLNESFGVFTNGWDVITQDAVNISNLSNRPLANRIFSNDSLQLIYLNYISQMISGPASYDSVSALVDRLRPVIEEYVAADTNKLYDYQHFVDNLANDVTIGMGKVIPGIKAFSQARTANLTLQSTYLRIYPGDTDNNGVVNALDILPVGIYFLISGRARSGAKISWLGQRTPSWDTSAATYADANGDGVIDENDIVGIGVNWGNTHSTTAQSFEINPGDVAYLRPFMSNLRTIYNNLSGDSEPVKQIKVLIETILDLNPAVPSEFALSQNYPNPFNLETNISFSLDKDRRISIAIYDITGKLIARLIANQSFSSGSHCIRYDASRISSGIYFYRLSSEEESIIHKMVIVK